MLPLTIARIICMIITVMLTITSMTYDTYGNGGFYDAALDHCQDYLHDNYGDAYNNFYDIYDTYGNGGFYDAALDHGQDYLNDNYGDAYNNFYDSYDTYGFDTYDSYSYGDSYGD